MPDKNQFDRQRELREDSIRESANDLERKSLDFGNGRDAINHSTIKYEQPTKEDIQRFLEDD